MPPELPEPLAPPESLPGIDGVPPDGPPEAVLPPLDPDGLCDGGNGDSLPPEDAGDSWGGNGDSLPPLEPPDEPELGDPPPELPDEPELGEPPPDDGDCGPDGELVEEEDVVRQPASADAASTGQTRRSFA